MKPRPIVMASLVCALVGLGFISSGLTIQAKAVLAQYLLQDAWAQTLSGHERVKPWSWADTWPVARLRYSRENIDLIVLEGASGSSLAFAPGHLHGTALPGGEGYSVISAHRDTHFSFLQKVNKGDIFTLQDTSGLSHEYKVNSTIVVDERQAVLPELSSSKGLMLVTCYPFNAVRAGGHLRYIVFATEEKEEVDI